MLRHIALIIALIFSGQSMAQTYSNLCLNKNEGEEHWYGVELIFTGHGEYLIYQEAQGSKYFLPEVVELEWKNGAFKFQLKSRETDEYMLGSFSKQSDYIELIILPSKVKMRIPRSQSFWDMKKPKKCTHSIDWKSAK